MAIKMALRENRTAPLVFCDFCNRQIDDADDGNYEWAGTGTDGEPEDVFFTHKGCSGAFRAADPVRQMWSSMELKVFPLFLANNLGVKPEDAAATAALLSEFY